MFLNEGKKTIVQHTISFLRMAACYALTGLVISPIIKLLLASIGLPYWMASLCALCLMVPLNFLMNKFWAFTGE